MATSMAEGVNCMIVLVRLGGWLSMIRPWASFLSSGEPRNRVNSLKPRSVMVL
jgi:hypothetical protein